MFKDPRRKSARKPGPRQAVKDASLSQDPSSLIAGGCSSYEYPDDFRAGCRSAMQSSRGCESRPTQPSAWDRKDVECMRMFVASWGALRGRQVRLDTLDPRPLFTIRTISR